MSHTESDKKEYYNKHSFLYVKEFCFSRKIQLLSSDYVNAHKKLELFCLICNTKWMAIFNSIQQGRGCPSCGKINEINSKIIKYGTASPSKFEKTKQTMLERYGVDCSFKNKKVQDKIKQTNLNKYGVENPQQNKEIALKTAKSSNRSYALYHWKTNEEVVCVGSYEKNAVDFFNKNQIDFWWQPKIFKIFELNTTYRPDLYLPEGRLWVEVKGYFRQDAQEKWEWFHKKYPNSELWDEEKLKQLEIL